MTFPYPHGALPVAVAPYAMSTGMAERVLLLSPRDSDLATLVASTAVTTLPVTNLQSPEPSKKWRSTSTTGQYIDITLAAGLGCNAAALVGHNLSGAGLWRVRGYAALADVGSTAASDTGWQSVWAGGVKPTDAAWAHHLALVRWTSSGDHRWWRIEFADPAPTTTHVEAGRLVLGVAFQPSLNCDLGGAVGWVPDDVQEPTPYGQTFTDPRPYRKRRFVLPFGAMDQDEAHEGAMQFARLRGLAGDLICCIDPGEVERFHTWSMQGLLIQGSHDFTPQPLFMNGRMMWGFTFTLVEKL